MTPPFDSELLLRHVAWVRALARELVRDEHAAEDLAQEACAIALERPAADAAGWRAWAATVVRNLARQRARGEGRRRWREEASARAEALAPADEVVERAHAGRRLVEAVLELEEPYRTALLLRWFEGLAPRDIARRTGAPVQTVRSRLHRGLARLREVLDRRHGGERGAWVVALVPLAAPRASLTPLHGVLLVNAKLVLTAALVLAAGTVAAVVSLRGSPGETPVRATEAAAAPRATEPLAVQPRETAAGPAEAEEGHRAPAPRAPAPAQAARSEPAAPAPPALVRGRVLDADARPVGGIPLRLEGEPRVVRSGAGGVFELETRSQGGRISADSPDWVTVREGVHRAGSQNEPVVVVAPALLFGGAVVDELGRPVSGARIALQLPDGFDTRFGEILESTHPTHFGARTDEHGRFALPPAPGVAESRLVALLDGYAPTFAPVPPVSDLALQLVLARPERPAEGALSGRVVGPDGRPVADAHVATGLTSTKTDERGEFHLDLARAVTAEELVAVKAGFLPAQQDRPLPPESGNAGWPDWVELALGGPPLALRGRLVDPDGRALDGRRVWIADGTRFGTIGMMPASLEALAGGAPVPPEAVQSALFLPSVDGEGEDDWTTARNDAPSSAVWSWVRTDAEGRFELRGLLDRDYRIRVLDEDLLALWTSEPLAPSAGELLIEVPFPEVLPRIAGRVVDDRGAPVEGVRVGLRRDPYEASSRVRGGRASIVMTFPKEGDVTDAEGRFEIERVPREGMRLDLTSERIVPRVVDLDPEGDPLALELAVDVRCHLSVELEDPELADLFAVEDADGERLEVHVLTENSHEISSDAEIVDGRSGVVSVSSRARRIVLLKHGAFVETIPIEPRPGEVNRVTR